MTKQQHLELISVVIPAYNEESRLPKFLSELLPFTSIINNNWEVILVNDGSSDKTLNIMEDFSETKPHVKIVSYENNHGKGYAIKKGIDVAKGEKIIFIDADGSINPDQIPKMIDKLDYFDIVIGDRSLKQSNIKQPFFRTFIGKLFNLYVRMLFQSNITDNLCGFKGFKQQIAKQLFSDLNAQGWLFDVEIFFKANKKKYGIYRLPINWEHRENSKIKLIDPLKMAFQLIKLRIMLYGMN